MTEDTLSATMRDYLVHVYRLADAGVPEQPVGTSELADVLQVSPPAVNRMVTKLRELGYLQHERYQGITLTTSGQQEALKQLRRHRIVEAFLVNVMGFGWHEVHYEAERMASSLDDRVVQRMYDMAGSPTESPHGAPIPTLEGVIPTFDDVPLAHVEPHHNYELRRVLTHEPDRLEYLAALGLKPGVILKLLHIAPFNGPIQLQLGREYRIIGHTLAEHLRVRQAD